MGFLWDDIDLDARTAYLRRSLLNRPDPVTGRKVLTLGPTKTRQSIRSIRMPEITVRELRRHKVAQDERRLAAGPHWRDEHGMVFTTTIGTPVDPANLRRAVRDIRAAAGITKAVVPYDFRRGAASILSAAGVPGEQIVDVMGNDPKSALSIYRRHMEPIVEVAVAPMDELFGSA